MEEYLIHHGIKGQKWGDCNGPPYPLKAGAHTPVQKTGIGKDAASKVLAKTGNKDLAGMDPVTAYYVSQFAALAALIAVAKISAESQLKKDVKKNQEASKNSNLQKKIEGKHTAEEDLKAVNPDYADPTDMSARMNCTMCSTAYELRRRGYDVVANKTSMGRKDKQVASWFGLEKKDINTFKTRDDFAKALSNEPDGARGLTFSAYGQFNSHHCMIWEKRDGKVYISDGQCNAPPKSIKESGISANGGGITYRYFRTDNANVNWDAIGDAVKERTDE